MILTIILISISILSIAWAIFEAIQKTALIYFITKKDIPLSDYEIAECTKLVIKHYLHLK